MLTTNDMVNNQASIHAQSPERGKNMIINMTEIYTGMSAIVQRGSGLSLLSFSFCGISFDMVLIYEYQNLKLMRIIFKYESKLYSHMRIFPFKNILFFRDNHGKP